MIIVSSPIRLVLAAGATAVVLAFGGCGADQAKLQESGKKLQESGQQVQRDAAQIAKDVKSGKITQEEADKQLEAKTKEFTDQAKETTGTAIDVAKDQAGVPDEAKKALEDAQQQLDATP